MIRVTEVLNYFKEPWYIDWIHKVGRTEANKISKESMKIGSRVDEIIKTNGAPTPKDKQEVHSCIAAFNKWYSLYTPLNLIPGTRLFKKIEEVDATGEPDLFVDDVLVDIKCSSKISKNYWIQVNMYRLLHGSTGKVAILRLDKENASFEYVVQNYNPFLCDVWVGMCRAMMYLRGDENGGLDIQKDGEIKEVA